MGERVRGGVGGLMVGAGALATSLNRPRQHIEVVVGRLCHRSHALSVGSMPKQIRSAISAPVKQEAG